MIDPVAIIEAASAAVMVLGAVYNTARVAFKVDENTKATDKLSAAYEKHADHVGEKLSNHEVRITVLEAKS